MPKFSKPCEYATAKPVSASSTNPISTRRIFPPADIAKNESISARTIPLDVSVRSLYVLKNKEGSNIMQAITFATENVQAPVGVSGSQECPHLSAISMRALRRKARRISAYARFNVEMLTAMAVEVESDLAALRH